MAIRNQIAERLPESETKVLSRSRPKPKAIDLMIKSVVNIQPLEETIEMDDAVLLTKLADLVIRHLKPTIPIEVDLWDIKTIVQLLKRSDSQVRERIVCLPSFPKAIRLPSESGRQSRPLWKASEVIAWTEKYREIRTKCTD